ncbi:hypothetical protein [Chloroflexus sp.]|uniref:hypothetical protein n=1 Tax=Chloroflexus sp. TaxID=1904827 RepID=UPI00404A6164
MIVFREHLSRYNGRADAVKPIPGWAIRWWQRIPVDPNHQEIKPLHHNPLHADSGKCLNLFDNLVGDADQDAAGTQLLAVASGQQPLHFLFVAPKHRPDH